jgi:hyperosmotically inducible periplasmic protein
MRSRNKVSVCPTPRSVCASEQIQFQKAPILFSSPPIVKDNPMNSKLATTCFLLATFLAPVVANADSDADRAHPSAFVKDSAITTKIKAKLADEKMSSLMNVSVDTDNRGEVFLSGKVKTQREADKAVALAHETEGVTAVTSSIQVRKDD